MTGGSLTWPSTSGPVFYVTNSTGVITLKHVAISGSSPILVKAAADQWGTSGRNGGTVILTADSELLAGNLVCDAISAISLTLKNSSSLTGSVDSASLALDGGSTWTVTATSHVTAFSDPSGISGGMVANVTGNGHTVFYNAALAANTPLGGKTFQLLNGGSLAPESVSSVHSTEPGAPANFSLAQSYPNPCNPAAIIRHGLPARARVTLSVYNLLGQLIGTLVRETEDAGFHEAAFDGTGLPSGVYFYRLEAGGFVQAKRLILTR